MEFDFGGRLAAESDDLEDTVDYDLLAQKIQAHVETSQYNLIERVAVEVGHLVMAEEMIDSCTLRITKPAALKEAESVSVTETFSR